MTGPTVGDAFGRTLADCWAADAAPGTVFEIVERDDGHLSAGDAAHYFTTYDAWPSHEQWAVDRVHGRVLDVGCGAGRHGVVLRERDFDVLGVDPSRGAVAVAQARGLTARQAAVPALPADIGDFDTFLLLGNNLGLLGGAAQAVRVFAALSRIARPGARLLGNSVDPHGGGEEHRAYHAWNTERGRLPGQVRIRVRRGTLASDWFDYLLLSVDELRALLPRSGWALVDVVTDGPCYSVHLERDET